MYTGLCVATAITTVIFWILFRGLNAKEAELNALEDKGEKSVKATEISAGGKTDAEALAAARKDSYFAEV